MDFLIGKAILDARENRYSIKLVQAGGSGTLIEMASILPGWPKQHGGLARIFSEGVKEMVTDLQASLVVAMSDAAGYYALARSSRGAEDCKRSAVALEERLPWNRLLDIDCFTEGGAVTRRSLGLPERRCLVCDDAHFRCIHEKRHPAESAAFSAAELIKSYLEYMTR